MFRTETETKYCENSIFRPTLDYLNIPSLMSGRPKIRTNSAVEIANITWSMKQEVQLMVTNLRDACGGQSRTPNIVPFHMIDIVSYCATVTLSSRRAVFTIFDFKNVVTLKSGSDVTQGH